jgi:hypothetical protein
MPVTPRRSPPPLAVGIRSCKLPGSDILLVVREERLICDASIAPSRCCPSRIASAAPENEYLALGVQDEILTMLTRVGDPARHSS